MARKGKKTVTVNQSKDKLQPTVSKGKARAKTKANVDMLFGKQNYIYMIGAFALILLGMALMAGGKQLPTEWNESEIYSFRRTVLAPIVILMGLGVGFLAIFKNK